MNSAVSLEIFKVNETCKQGPSLRFNLRCLVNDRLCKSTLNDHKSIVVIIIASQNDSFSRLLHTTHIVKQTHTTGAFK